MKDTKIGRHVELVFRFVFGTGGPALGVLRCGVIATKLPLQAMFRANVDVAIGGSRCECEAMTHGASGC